MGIHFAFWPPPWKRDSTFQRAMGVVWLVAMIPLIAVLMILAILTTIVGRLTGWGTTVSRTRGDVCRTIEGFVDGTCGDWDWDDFTSVADSDPAIEKARVDCIAVADRFPPDESGGWCGPGGVEELLRIAGELRRSPREHLAVED